MKNVTIALTLLFNSIISYSQTQKSKIWEEEISYNIQFNNSERSDNILRAYVSDFHARPIVSNYDFFIEYLYNASREGNLSLYNTDKLGSINLQDELTNEQLQQIETRIDTIYHENISGELEMAIVDSRLKLENYKAIYFTQQWAFDSKENKLEAVHPNILFSKEAIDELTGEFRGYKPVFYVNQNQTFNKNNTQWAAEINFGTANKGNDNIELLSHGTDKVTPIYCKQLKNKQNATLVELIINAMEKDELKVYVDEELKNEIRKENGHFYFNQEVYTEDPADDLLYTKNVKTEINSESIEGLRVKQLLYFDETDKELKSIIQEVGLINGTKEVAVWVKL